MIKIFQVLLWVVLVVICSCTHDSQFDPVEAPSNLSYSPDSAAVEAGQVASSSAPVLSGTRPFSFSIRTTPANGGSIDIDENGVIRVNSQAMAGKYFATVVVANSAGSVSFSNIYKIRVYDAPTPPSDLVYIPDTVSILTGNSFTSTTPGISGTAPFTFTILGNPEPDKIFINNQGIVSTTDVLAVGSYALNIQVVNSQGSATLNNALVLVVTTTDLPPSALSYSPDSITLDSGATAMSVIPSISGTEPFIFSLTSLPDASSAITIDNDGIMTATSSLSPGVYTITVQVTNNGGTTVFPDVFTITVNAVNKVTFTDDILPFVNQYCSTCHTTGPNTLYSNYDNASRDINLILDRVQRKPGSAGFMPKNNPPLKSAQIQLLKDWLAQGLLP
ncbi:MAG: hypothetical protein WEB30_10270 [Cyclobacteriaceae bacterium]